MFKTTCQLVNFNDWVKFKVDFQMASIHYGETQSNIARQLTFILLL